MYIHIWYGLLHVLDGKSIPPFTMLHTYLFKLNQITAHKFEPRLIDIIHYGDNRNRKTRALHVCPYNNSSQAQITLYV